VDAANASVGVAQQNMAAATLASPISGTVVQVGFTVGQNSGRSSITIFGPGQDELTTTVQDSDIGKVHVGQDVTITPDGSSGSLTGKVAMIGALGSSSSSGSATFPVTISLNTTNQQLMAGAAASASIILSSTHAAITVPTSAVVTRGSSGDVTVLKNGSTTSTRVTLGTVGATLAQVTSGLNAGEAVVLADLNAPLPTATNQSTARIIGGGGFSGGGGGGAPPGCSARGVNWTEHTRRRAYTHTTATTPRPRATTSQLPGCGCPLVNSSKPSPTAANAGPHDSGHHVDPDSA
jgi:HlyD family secretion protein